MVIDMNFEQNIDEKREINLNGTNFTYLGIKKLCLLNDLIIIYLKKYSPDFNPDTYYENPRLDKNQLDVLFAGLYVKSNDEIFQGDYVVDPSSSETISDIFDRCSMDARDVVCYLKQGYKTEEEKRKYNILVDLSSSLIQRAYDKITDTHKSR